MRYQARSGLNAMCEKYPRHLSSLCVFILSFVSNFLSQRVTCLEDCADTSSRLWHRISSGIDIICSALLFLRLGIAISQPHLFPPDQALLISHSALLCSVFSPMVAINVVLDADVCFDFSFVFYPRSAMSVQSK